MSESVTKLTGRIRDLIASERAVSRFEKPQRQLALAKPVPVQRVRVQRVTANALITLLRAHQS
eukprot:3754672-Prymnesium_polylepis.1